MDVTLLKKLYTSVIPLHEVLPDVFEDDVLDNMAQQYSVRDKANSGDGRTFTWQVVEYEKKAGGLKKEQSNGKEELQTAMTINMME